MVVLLFIKGTFGILKRKSESCKDRNHHYPRGIIPLDHNYSVEHLNDANSFSERSKLPLLVEMAKEPIGHTFLAMSDSGLPADSIQSEMACR